jgi:hypothetical protein
MVRVQAKRCQVDFMPTPIWLRRAVLYSLLVITAVLVLLVGRIAYVACFGGPKVSVAATGSTVTVDFHFMADYCIGISRVLLKDARGKPVWEIIAPHGSLCSLRLALGSNPVRPDDAEGYSVAVPASGQSFMIGPGVYTLYAWGNNGWGHEGQTTRRLEFRRPD